MIGGVESSSGRNDGALPTEQRCLRRLQWRAVFGAQQVGFATICFTVPFLLALILVGAITSPVTRPFHLYDATISYKTNKSTIPFWGAWLVPGLFFLVSVLVGELRARRESNRSITTALATVLHFVIDSVCALVFVSFLTELAKNLCGVIRPDFLDRCQANVPTSMADVKLLWGGSNGVPNMLCTNPDEQKITDGHRSFPSGHSSAAAMWAAYTSVYFTWATTWGRRRRPGCNGAVANNGPSPAAAGLPAAGAGMRAAITHALALYWVLFNLSWAFGVGISRIIDNKHAPADVCAGWLLGVAVGAVFAVRAIAVHPSAPPP